MTTIPYTDRLAELDRRIAEGTIARGSWDVCLLSALSPEVLRAENASACPSDVMPPWLAHLTPDIDDLVSEDYWPDMLREYSRAAHVWQAIDTDGWDLCHRRHFVRCIDIALESVTRDKWGVRDACAKVRRLLIEGGAGEEWKNADAAAGAADWAAAETAWPTAEAAYWAARTAARVVDWAATETAWSAGWAARATVKAAGAAAWDRMTRALLADITTLGEGGSLSITENT